MPNEVPSDIAEARKNVERATEKQARINEQWETLRVEWQQAENERLKYQSFIDVWFELHPQTDSISRADSVFLQQMANATIADAIALVLEGRANGHMNLGEIIRWLQQAGKLVGDSKYASSNLIKTMQRDPARFYKLSRGVWGLTKYKKPEAQVVHAPTVAG